MVWSDNPCFRRPTLEYTLDPLQATRETSNRMRFGSPPGSIHQAFWMHVSIDRASEKMSASPPSSRRTFRRVRISIRCRWVVQIWGNTNNELTLVEPRQCPFTLPLVSTYVSTGSTLDNHYLTQPPSRNIIPPNAICHLMQISWDGECIDYQQVLIIPTVRGHIANAH